MPDLCREGTQVSIRIRAIISRILMFRVLYLQHGQVAAETVQIIEAGGYQNYASGLFECRYIPLKNFHLLEEFNGNSRDEQRQPSSQGKEEHENGTVPYFPAGGGNGQNGKKDRSAEGAERHGEGYSEKKSSSQAAGLSGFHLETHHAKAQDLQPSESEYDKNNPDDGDRKSTRLNSSHIPLSRMPSSA